MITFGKDIRLYLNGSTIEAEKGLQFSASKEIIDYFLATGELSKIKNGGVWSLSGEFYLTEANQSTILSYFHAKAPILAEVKYLDETLISGNVLLVSTSEVYTAFEDAMFSLGFQGVKDQVNDGVDDGEVDLNVITYNGEAITFNGEDITYN